MDTNTAQVLKADKVSFEGQVHLDLDKYKQSRKDIPPSQPTQPRILEDTPEYVVIEITCSCGQKVLLKCTYKNV
jgi:hypothetical protein